jgi:dual-specificity kinase
LNSARYVIGAYFHLSSNHKDGVFELREVLQGEALFQTHENLEHLAMMERVLGPLPYHMLKKAEYVAVLDPYQCHKLSAMLEDYLKLCVLLFLLCSRHGEKYVRKGRLNWPEGCASRESMKAVMKLPRLQVLSISCCSRSNCDHV